jgi:(E)-4-hydroxy-3-methylbut-2-enyl-diphosphate synthase
MIIGGAAPIAVQTMIAVDPLDYRAVKNEIMRLSNAGAEIIRLALPNEQALEVLRKILPKTPVPLVADIHFSSRLAIAACATGIAGVRVNPGNIGGGKKLFEAARAAADHGTCLRIGVNCGSIEKRFRPKGGGNLEQALVSSALSALEVCRQAGAEHLKISVKGSDVAETVAAYRSLAVACDVPLHLGLSEAGPPPEGIVKSVVAMSTLLNEGIGDTIRISLTADPIWEVKTAISLLCSLGLRRPGLEIISCPTCGRANGDLFKLVGAMTKKLERYRKTPLKIALMGCEVNGPGEAAAADLGIALTKKGAVLFEDGKLTAKGKLKDLKPLLLMKIKAKAGKQK